MPRSIKKGPYIDENLRIKIEKLDDDGKIIGYIAGRKIPTASSMENALELYKTMKQDEE